MRSSHKPAKEWGSKARKAEAKSYRAADQALAVSEGLDDALDLAGQGLQVDQGPATVWADPRDCGLRMERGAWRSPRDAHESGMAEFRRLSARQEGDLVEWLRMTAQDDPTRWSPGEWAVLTIPDEWEGLG